MSIELLAAEKYIKQSLASGGLLPEGVKVFAGVVPEDEPLPAVLMSRQSARDTNGGGGARLLTEPVYFIRGVVDDTCLEALAPMAQAIDAAFQMTPDTPPRLVLGVIVRGGHRIEPIIGDSVEDGITYTYVGGLYRLFAYAPAAPVLVIVQTETADQGYADAVDIALVNTPSIASTEIADQGYSDAAG